MPQSAISDDMAALDDGASPTATINGPLGWIGLASVLVGLLGLVAANISLTGWLVACAMTIAGPVLIVLDLRGQAAAASQTSREDTSERVGSGTLRRIIGYVTLLGILLGAAAMLLSLDAAKAPLRDLSPGSVVDRGPDRPNPGCPVRSWSIGDYVPQACLDRHSYGRFARREGLQTIVRSGVGDIHRRQWIRLGRDVIGGECAPHTGCRVTTVVRDRFSMGALDIEPVTDTDARRQPTAYAVATAAALVLRLFPILLAGVLLVEGFASRGRRPGLQG
jgi:hypothetical protein